MSTEEIRPGWKFCKGCGHVKRLSDMMADPRTGRTRNKCKQCKADYDSERYRRLPERFEARNWVSSFRRRARLHGLDAAADLITRTDIIGIWGDRCFYCKAGKFEQIDHLVAVAAGGRHTLDNVLPCCRACNSRKRWDTDQALIRQFRAALAIGGEKAAPGSACPA
jgi:5-methylcytosine-specific restriction endonuclease McrA